MRAGTLNSVVVIERYIEADDEYGEPIKSWIPLYEMRADVKQLSGNEKYISAEKIALSTHSVTLRYIDDITTKDKLVFKGNNYDIISVINKNEESRDLIILCKELING